MERTIKLRVPSGTNGVSHGAHYFAAREGCVEVPESVAAALLRSHAGMREVGRQRDDEMAATPIFSGKRTKG